MELLKVTWTGLRPLIEHSWEGLDELHPMVVRKKELTDKKKKKTEADLEELRWLDWRLSLYWDDEAGLYVPSDNVEKCVRDGAAKARLGKQAEAACWVLPTEIPLKAGVKVKSPEELYKREEFRFRRPVRIPPRTGSRVMSLRAVIPTGWSLTFELNYDERVINGKDLAKAMQVAGTYVGLGIWRPKFGRFAVEVGEE